MERIPNSIDYDQINIRGKHGICLEYVLLARIKRKYINKICENIKSICKKIKGQKQFNRSLEENKKKIYYIVESVDKFNKKDLQILLEKEMSLIDFIHKSYDIRKRNIKLFNEKSKVRSQDV